MTCPQPRHHFSRTGQTSGSATESFTEDRETWFTTRSSLTHPERRVAERERFVHLRGRGRYGGSHRASEPTFAYEDFARLACQP
jgi:hypothetical protein